MRKGYKLVLHDDVIVWAALDDRQSNLRPLPKNRLSASVVTKDSSGRSRAHLAVSTEQVLFRALLCKSISHFAMVLNGSPCDYVITYH